MGFDVYGVKPKNETGKYFRNNIWWWRPIWQYITIRCEDILTEKDIKEGEYNNGHLISATKSRQIKERLQKLLKNGAVARYELAYTKEMEEMPDESCEYCNKTGIRTSKIGEVEEKHTCNVCGGKGSLRPFVTNYPFKQDNVKRFVEFLENNNGFKIY